MNIQNMGVNPNKLYFLPSIKPPYFYRIFNKNKQLQIPACTVKTSSILAHHLTSLSQSHLEAKLKNYNIILSGATICNDKELKKSLGKFSTVYTIPQHLQIEQLQQKKECHLIFFEISKNSPNDVDIIRKILKMNPEILSVIIVNNDDTGLIANALNSGAIDVFRKPYKYELIAERVKTLLLQKASHP
jgi:PleD family two-component response regulator